MKCDKCDGKVFVDMTFTDNRTFETFCLRCGKRWFISESNELYPAIREYVQKKLSG